MLDEYRELIDFLAQTPTQLKDSAAAAANPPEGEWNAAQVIGHLAACEFYFVERLNRLLREESPHLRSISAKATERQQSMMDASVDENLQAFNELRGESVSMLMSLALNLWDRAGTYENAGKMSIEDVVELMIDHDAEHLAQIQGLMTK